jgi:hypothetical protein
MKSLRERKSKSGRPGLKHLRAVLEYATPRKLANLALCEWEKARRVATPRSMPYTATIDVTNVCNLRCPHCPTGAGLLGRKPSMLDLGLLRRFLDESGPYLFIAYLYNWGETLLHQDAAEIVRTVHERRISTSLSSHLSVARGQVLDDVCDAGLDHLIASIDGATAAVYEQYRRRGDFDLVLENLRRVVAWRERHRRRTPRIDWQFIAFKHNEHEIDAARALARRIGVDTFTVKAPTAPEESLPSFGGEFYGGSSFCGQLWHDVVLQADGGVGACCNLFTADDDLGDFKTASIRAIRNGARAVQARRLFDPAAPAPPPDHPCLRCPIVHTLPHLAGHVQPARREDVMGVVPLTVARGGRRVA